MYGTITWPKKKKKKTKYPGSMSHFSDIISILEGLNELAYYKHQYKLLRQKLTMPYLTLIKYIRTIK